MAGALDHRIGETLLGKYSVKSILGRGGMGVVYDAEDLRLGRHVAIKVLNSAARSQKDADQRFHLEARAIASLIHPHLVTLLDYDFLEDGTPCMVMERVEGMSLKASMSRRKFTPLEVTLVLYQTLLALAACHAKGVIHRDLKPENLLLTRGGQQGITVKVIDFGLTKLLADSGAGSLTVNGQVFGSPRFMAPEQWLQKEVTGRTDIYALGLIGYCLLRGEHFITAQNPFEICRAHLSQARPPLRATADGTRIPTLLDHVLRKAADPDPRNRYDSAEAMIAALEPLTIDALALTRFTGENLTVSGPLTDELRASPFDAAAVAASIDASIAAGEMESIELTEPGLDGVAKGLAPADLPDAFADAVVNDPQVEPRAGHEALTTALLQPALNLSPPAGQPDPEPTPTEAVHNRVKFAVAGGMFTAITKGDVDRAMNDAAQAAVDDGPEANSPTPRRAPSLPPEPALALDSIEASAPTVVMSSGPLLAAVAAALPVAAVTAAPATRSGRGPELKRATVELRSRPEPVRARRRDALLITLGVVAAAGVGATVAWFWM